MTGATGQNIQFQKIVWCDTIPNLGRPEGDPGGTGPSARTATALTSMHFSLSE